MVERSYGKISLVAIASQETQYNRNKDKYESEAREKFLAFLFMDGGSKKVFGYLMNDLSGDFTLGSDNYPETVKDSLQVMSLRVAKVEEINCKKKKKENGGLMETSFAQQESGIKCWKCGQRGHIKKDCPGLDDSDTTLVTSSMSHLTGRTSWSG